VILIDDDSISATIRVDLARRTIATEYQNNAIPPNRVPYGYSEHYDHIGVLALCRDQDSLSHAVNIEQL